MSPSYVSIYLKSKTQKVGGGWIRPMLPPNLLKHTIRTGHAYRADLGEVVTRVDIESINLPAFRGVLAGLKVQGISDEVVPGFTERMEYINLIRLMDAPGEPFDV